LVTGKIIFLLRSTLSFYFWLKKNPNMATATNQEDERPKGRTSRFKTNDNKPMGDVTVSGGSSIEGARAPPLLKF